MNNTNTNKNNENKFDINSKNSLDNKTINKPEYTNPIQNIISNFFQNAFTFEENCSQKKISKFFENLNNNYYNNNIYQLVNFPNNIYYNNGNNGEFLKKNNNYKKNKIDIVEPNNEPSKKNTFCRRPNDWICTKCYNLNFAFRIYCNRCSEPKDISIFNNNF